MRRAAASQLRDGLPSLLGSGAEERGQATTDTL